MSARPDAIQNLLDVMNSLSETYQEVEAMLKEITILLDKEKQETQGYEDVVGKRPPSIAATDLTREARKYQDAHKKASESNETLNKAMQIHIANLRLFMLPIWELEKKLPPIDPLTEEEESVIKKMEIVMNKVSEMKHQRTVLVGQLRDSIHEDDITLKIVTYTGEDKQELFRKEVIKHQKPINLINQNLAAQENILAAVKDAYGVYGTTRHQLKKKHGKRDTMVQALILSFDAYEDLITKSNNGLEFYNKLHGSVKQLLQRVRSTCKVQEEERQQVLSTITDDDAKRNNELPTHYGKDLAAPARIYNDISGGGGGGGRLKLKDYLNMKKETGKMSLIGGPPVPNANYNWVPGIRPAPVGSEGSDPNPPDAYKYKPGQIYADDPSYKYQYPQQKTSNVSSNWNLQYPGSNPLVDPNAGMQHGPYPATYGAPPSYDVASATPSYTYEPSKSPSPAYLPPAAPSNHFNQREASPAVSQTYASSFPASTQPYGAYAPPPGISQSNQVYPPHSSAASNAYASTQSYYQTPASGNAIPDSQGGHYYQTTQQAMPGYSEASSMPGYPATASSMPGYPTTATSMPGYTPTSSSMTGYSTATTAMPSSNVNSPSFPGYTPSSSSMPAYSATMTSMPGYSPSSSSMPAYSAAMPGYTPSSMPGYSTATAIPGNSVNTPSMPGYTPSSSSMPGYVPQGHTQPLYQSPQVPTTVASTYPPNQGATPSYYPIPSESAPKSHTSVPYYPPQNYGAVQPSDSATNYSQSAVYPSQNPASIDACSKIFENATDFSVTQSSSIMGTNVFGSAANVPSYTFVDQQNWSYVPPQVGYQQRSGSLTSSSLYTNTEAHAYNPISSGVYLSTPTTPDQQPPQSAPSYSAPSGMGQWGGIQSPIQSPVTYRQAGRGFPEAHTVTTSSANEAKTTSAVSSNVDLLAGLDCDVKQAPLVPQITSDSAIIKGKTDTNIRPEVINKVEALKTETEVVISSKEENSRDSQKECQERRGSRQEIPESRDSRKDIPERRDIKAELDTSFVTEVEKFEKFVSGLTLKTLNGPTALDLKWKDINDLQEAENGNKSISVARCYPMKNRFPDILPYDQSRIELPSTKDDYINASYLKALSPSLPPLILAQAPIPVTFTDFWAMILEQGVEVVVCLLGDNEIGDDVYWPVDKTRDMALQPSSSLKVSLQTCNARPGWVERIVSVSDGKMSRVVVHLQLIAWPGSSFPASPGPFLAFVQEVKTFLIQQRSASHPAVVHCLSGVGRTGLLAAILCAVVDIENSAQIPDVVSIVARINNARKNSLRDREHLKFLYQSVLYFCQDLLLKQGILTTKTFDERSVKDGKCHTRHPSQDLLMPALQHLSLQEADQRSSAEPHSQDTSAPPALAVSFSSSMDPNKFSMSDSNSVKQKIKFTPDNFINPTPTLVTPANVTADPLSSLDPLWSLKK